MARNLFTRDEVVLCTYIAIHGRGEFSEGVVQKITHRSLASILMKVQNIAAMLREEGYTCSPQISSLAGLPAGMTGRRTNWDVVKTLPLKDRTSFLALCRVVLEAQGLSGK